MFYSGLFLHQKEILRHKLPLEKLYPLHQTGNSLILEDIEKENNNNKKTQDVLKCPLATFMSLMVLL